MIFRQLFDTESCSYTYLVGDEGTGHALLVDPVREHVDRDLTLVSELGLSLKWVLETHLHADHVTGAGALRERTGARVLASQGGAPCVDVHVAGGYSQRVGALELRVLATPGHTDDSLSYLVGGKVFTGDSLLIRTTGRTDFQNGDPGQLYDSITGVLFALPDETEICPGHDYAGMTLSTIGEEKRHNPRLAGKRREEFVEFMKSRKLPPPKKLAEALPANRACGVGPPSQA